MEVPTRTCIACRRPAAKTTLTRLAAPGGTVQVDPTASLPGRGAYVCRRPGCVDAALRRDGAAVARALRIDRQAVDTGDLRAALAAAAGPTGCNSDDEV